MTAGAPVPLTVVTGFLGSGKTTLIAALLRRPELARAAVIVNEFGEIGLDHELVESSEEDLVELSTGCICCASRGDLAAAVARLAAKRGEGRAIDRIVLETTGLADPAPIAQAAMVDPALRAFVRLDRIVATVDAVAGIETLDAREESRSQAALADVLLLTKTDMEGARTAEVERRLSALAPHARRVVAVRGAVEPALVLAEEDADGAAALRAFPDSGPGARGHDHGHDHGHGHEHGDIASVSLRFAEPLPAVALTLFLQALAETLGPDLLRAKGIVAVAEAPETPAVVHGVRHVFHPMRWLDRWPDGPRESRIVLIGKGVARGWVEALLAIVAAEAAEASGQEGAPAAKLRFL